MKETLLLGCASCHTHAVVGLRSTETFLRRHRVPSSRTNRRLGQMEKRPKAPKWIHRHDVQQQAASALLQRFQQEQEQERL
jgi:hypothetical protein